MHRICTWNEYLHITFHSMYQKRNMVLLYTKTAHNDFFFDRKKVCLFTLVIFFEWTVCITEGLNSRIWEIPSVFISHWCLIHVFGLKTKRQIVDCHSGQFSQQIHYSRRIASVYCWKIELTISFLLEWVIINNKKKRTCFREH